MSPTRLIPSGSSAGLPTSFLARCCLDQPASFQQGKYSLNYSELCLTLVDTLRSVASFSALSDGIIVLRGGNGIAASPCSNCRYLAGNGRPASSTPGVDVSHGNMPFSGGIQICDPKCHVLSRTVFLMVTLHPNIARLEQLRRFIALIDVLRASK